MSPETGLGEQVDGEGLLSLTRGFMYAGATFIGIIGAGAQQERLRISERTKAGMARVRASGTHIGRPRKQCDLLSARRLREQGMSYTAIAKKMQLSRAMVWKRLNLPASGWV